MRHGKLTRDQVIAIFGDDVVKKLDYVNCEPTSRLQTDGDEDMEWSASIKVEPTEDYPFACALIAYYYTTPEQNQIMADNDGDGASINWEIHGYEIQ